jgi:hypothetical protein
MLGFTNIAGSTQFSNLAKTLTPVWNSPDFLPLLRRFPPGLLVNFLPPDVLNSLVFPGAADPIDQRCVEEATKKLLSVMGAVVPYYATFGAGLTPSIVAAFKEDLAVGFVAADAASLLGVYAIIGLGCIVALLGATAAIILLQLYWKCVNDSGTPCAGVCCPTGCA